VTTAAAIRKLRAAIVAIAWLAFIFGVLCTLGGAVWVVDGFVDGPRVGRAGICRTGQHHNCLATHQARVESVGAENAVRISYDDGREHATLYLRGAAHPPARAFVRVERWGGTIVAISDRHGRRYKEQHWPVRWDRWPFGMTASGIVLMLPVALLKAWRIRRSRRR
jgi:hypothetical protein